MLKIIFLSRMTNVFDRAPALAFLWLVSTYYPANTKRNEHVIITSKRCFDGMITCLLRWVFTWYTKNKTGKERGETTGDPLHSRALAHSRAPLFTQPCPHCSHSRAPGEQWARLCVFTLQGCVQAARLCRGSPVETGRERERPKQRERDKKKTPERTN